MRSARNEHARPPEFQLHDARSTFLAIELDTDLADLRARIDRLRHALFRGVLVGDRENDRIQVFDLDGKHLVTWDGGAPYGMALDRSQRLFMADGRANQVVRINRRGTIDLRWGRKGDRAGEFNLPHMLAIDPTGNIYVAEVGGQRFQKFKPITKP